MARAREDEKKKEGGSFSSLRVLLRTPSPSPTPSPLLPIQDLGMVSIIMSALRSAFDGPQDLQMRLLSL